MIRYVPTDIPVVVAHALAEDIGSGDLTAPLVPNTPIHATLLTREAGVLCGRPWFDETFRQLSPDITINWHNTDGDWVEPNTILCHLAGPARALLTGERTALNFLQTLSGTASRAHQYAAAVDHTRTKILDTRKTLPGLRTAQKYAVTCGGCENHRIGLFDGILIKENHIMAAGSILKALEQARLSAKNAWVEIEVENLQQLEEALAAHATRILVDNFTLGNLRLAVTLTQKRATLEASGGITLSNIAIYAETGVDYISVGDITKNVHVLDLSLRFNGFPHP